MSSTTNFSSNFRLVLDSLEEYAKKTGIDLRKDPFADELLTCDSPDFILERLQDRVKKFKDYRDGNRELINWLAPIVQVLHPLSAILGDGIGLVFFPARAVFVGVDILLMAAGGVSSSYDALVDIFECVGHFLKRLHIYTQIPFTPTMTDIIVKIMIEVLSVLALATQQIKQGRFKKFARKLLGESEIEAVLQRLDRLTQDEARMTATQTLEVVHGLVNNVKFVMDDGKVSTDGIRQALIEMQGMASEINKMRRDQLQEKIRNWLAPPDPSINHNIARRAHHDGTAAWFIQDSTFQEWKTAGSLLWIHGNPGSGKSILCSTIIQEAKAIYNYGLALMAYFYFDFKDTSKQDARGLLTSLLAQLSATSDHCHDILSDLYSRHHAGSQQPDDCTLTECLKDMLKFPGQPTVYIIVDALDECPNTSGFPTARERVLELLEELVDLKLPNLRLCVTSRHEVDIRTVLRPLTSLHVSLQDESGQNQDILDYVKSVVQSDRKMRRWRAEDKQLVIDTLSARAGGMFRWVFCQLETLRRSFPAAIRRALGELPESLDQTYERTLLGIEKEKREYAHRLLQCLTVSARPLRVKELAEILAIQFNAGHFPHYHVDWRSEDPQEAVLSSCSSLITVVNTDRSPVVQFSHFSVKEFLTSDRLANAGQNLSRYHILPESAHTILAQACLSVLFQLDDQVDRTSVENFPLAMYAAQHWVEHAQFENVSRRIEDAMERLFDRDRPYFLTWVRIHDIDYPFREPMFAMHPIRPGAAPSYYAALCGFRGLVEHLIDTCPRDVSARGGYHATPLHAALEKGNVAIALLLLEHDADVNTLDNENMSPLHRASQSGRHDHVEFLLEHHADVNIRNEDGETPLFLASREGELEVTRVLLQHGALVDPPENPGWTPLMSASRCGHPEIVRLLLECGAAVDSRDTKGWTPLIAASRCGYLDIVRLLLQNGAAVDSRDNEGWTPLQSASRYGHLDIVQELLGHGADVNAQKENLWTALHLASGSRNLEIAQLLVQRGAAVDVKNQEEKTPLWLASDIGEREMASMLLEHSADPNIRDKNQWTPCHTASYNGHLDIVCLLLEHGVDVNFPNGTLHTPLALASLTGRLEVSHFLIERSADVDSRDNNGWTPLHLASRYGHLSNVRLLLDHGADVNALNADSWTPLHLASINGKLAVTELLIQHSADVDRRNQYKATPLAMVSGSGKLEIARLLVKYSSNPNLGDINGWTPLHRAARNGHLDIVKLLLDCGADFTVPNGSGKTAVEVASSNGKLEVAKFLAARMGGGDPQDAIGVTSESKHPEPVLLSSSREKDADSFDSEGASLHTASRNGDFDTVQSLLDHGADVNDRNASQETALDVASREGWLQIAELLIKCGADVNARDKVGWTPLHKASLFRHVDVARLLLESGADVDAQKQDLWTPLHLASRNGYLEIVELLLERGANMDVRNNEGRTASQVALRRGERHISRFLSEYSGARGG